MNFEEHAAKPLLRAAGIKIPKSMLVTAPETAADAAAAIGPCVVKAQVPSGKRGKAGGIGLAASPDEARTQAARILGMTIGGYSVGKLLIEGQVPIEQEFYAAVLNDPKAKTPVMLFSMHGGMDIEEITAAHPDALIKIPIDIRSGAVAADIVSALPEDLACDAQALGELLVRLYGVYRDHDAELIEINPLALSSGGELIALDCKFSMDDGAIARHGELATGGAPDNATDLESRAKANDLRFIELDGNVGVLANGAGLTMTSMDAISHFGGSPANFLEIGGESYTKARPALQLVVENPKVKALLVNFCGAFARTDVMTEGVIAAWQELKPDIPIFFTIHGTGDEEARAMVRDRLGLEPYERMDEAVQAAVRAAADAGTGTGVGADAGGNPSQEAAT